MELTEYPRGEMGYPELWRHDELRKLSADEKESYARTPLYMRAVSDTERPPGCASPSRGLTIYEYRSGERRVFSDTSESPGSESDTPPCPCLHDPGYHLRDTSAGLCRPGRTSCT